jgi:hypothetical protein
MSSVVLYRGLMSINIKNSEAEAALRELVLLTGETQAQAVETAARERIHRLRARSRADLIWSDVKALQEMVTGEPLSTDGLYDDSGLPQ